MTGNEGTRAGQDAAMSQEIARAVNMLAHPWAGFAAASAIGFGMAGHALGLWAGTVAGAVEASQRAWQAHPADTVRRNGTPAPLKLVVSRPATKAGVRKPVVSAGGNVGETRRPTAIERPAAPDDLKAISGIGPKLEKVLNGLGLWTYRQISDLSAGEIDWLDGELGFAGRIGRDDWAGQARALQAGSVSAGA